MSESMENINEQELRLLMRRYSDEKDRFLEARSQNELHQRINHFIDFIESTPLLKKEVDNIIQGTGIIRFSEILEKDFNEKISPPASMNRKQELSFIYQYLTCLKEKPEKIYQVLIFHDFRKGSRMQDKVYEFINMIGKPILNHFELFLDELAIKKDLHHTHNNYVNVEGNVHQLNSTQSGNITFNQQVYENKEKVIKLSNELIEQLNNQPEINEEDQEEIVTYLDDMKEKLEEGKEVKKPFIKNTVSKLHQIRQTVESSSYLYQKIGEFVSLMNIPS